MKRPSIAIVAFITMMTIGAVTLASFCPVIKAEVPHGVISIAFDDNYDNQFQNAFPLLQNYGIVGTFYVVTDHVGLPGYMTYSQLQTLQSNGNEIGSHSKTHTTLTSLSELEIRQECSLSKQALESHGLTVTDFAYPNGPTNDFVDSIVSQYYRSGRTAYIEPYLMNIPTTQFRVAGFSAETANLTALSLLEDMVDQVYSTNSWAIIFFHNIIPNGTYQQYTTSTQDFESFLNYILTKGVQTLTVDQALNLTSFSITSNYGTVTPTSGIYNLGDTLTLEAFAPPVEEAERYVWLGWNGSGAGSYTGTDNPVMITLNGSVNQTALWRHEFRLSIVSDVGQTSPSAGDYWYEVGANVTLEASAPSEGDNERYLWKTWIGTGLGSYSGSNTSVSIVMDGPINETTSWVHQYKISVAYSGVDSDFSGNVVTIDGTSFSNGASFWYNDSSLHSFAFSSELEVNSGKRYVWISSSGLSTQKIGSIIVSKSGALTANYLAQFFVNVSSPYGAVRGSGWYDVGDSVYVTLDQSVVNASLGTRQLFTGWGEDASGINLTSDLIPVDGPKSAVALWKKQFLVSFDQTGLPIDQNATILVDSANHGLPFSLWADEGTSINYVYPNTLADGLGNKYVLASSSNQSLITVNSPLSIVGRYDLFSEPKPEYDVKPLVAIVASIIVVSLIAFVMLWKKMKANPRSDLLLPLSKNAKKNIWRGFIKEFLY
jgi:peptidoglycan/xylan/chitin deacetylase (PgdA/CDA1 family)